MFRLLKLCLGLVGLGAFVWWGLTAELGDRTLFGHLRAIGQTKESQELVRGTKQKVAEVKKRIAGEPEPPAPAQPPVEVGPPQDHLTEADRRQMRRLLESSRDKMPR